VEVELTEVDGITVEMVDPSVFVVVVTVVVLVDWGAVTAAEFIASELTVPVGFVELITDVSTDIVLGKVGDSLIAGVITTGFIVVVVLFVLLLLVDVGEFTIFFPPIAPRPNNNPRIIPASARSPNRASRGFGHL
jgi:hypothetical protein